MDATLLLDLNSFFLGTDQKSSFTLFVGNNPVPRGFPIFLSLVTLWFVVDCIKRRSRILIGLLATCLATVSSIWLQRHFTPHVRPFLDPTLHLKITDPHLSEGWDRLGSFPSDTATLFFSLAAIIFIESRLAGIFCFIWALIAAGIARVALGYHYPSDIVGALILGPGCVCLLNSAPHLRALTERVLELFETRIYVVHSVMFLFLAEAYNLFLGFQGVLKYLRILGG